MGNLFVCLQGMLQQCRRALKPDGLFLAAMFGGDTLHELRVSCNLAEEELQGGVSQRVSPLAQVSMYMWYSWRTKHKKTMIILIITSIMMITIMLLLIAVTVIMIVNKKQ